MPPKRNKRWLLLIHQIPPKPTSLRVKIWRRLQQVGAVAVKQSVYVMPHSEQTREDLNWTLKEIIEGGGDGSICEAKFLEGLTDRQIISLFHNARKSDYEKLIQEANALAAMWFSDKGNQRNQGSKAPAQLFKLHRRLDEINAIDFFQTPQRATAELLLQELENHPTGQLYGGDAADPATGDLLGKVWVTRENLFVDRIACGWLICRFIDPGAVFRFVREPQYTAGPNEIRFDMFDAEYTHEGDRCSFEVMISRLQLQDHALGPLSEVVHDIDLKDGKFARGETAGFNALLSGLVAAYANDDLRMKEGSRLFDNLYAYYSGQKR